MRVLIVAHAHPALATGGGQLATYELHQELLARNIESCFLAWSPSENVLAPFSVYGDSGREVLFHASSLNTFTFSQSNTWFVTHDFAQLLDRVRPDVVHFGHYHGVGLDVLHVIRARSPHVPIVLTLHEFLAMCHNRGTMLKHPGGALCHRPDPRACAACFPDRSADDFFLRERFIRSHLELVDRFIAPSVFLRDRYVEWGLPARKFDVIENGRPEPQHGPPASGAFVSGKGRVRFAFFGKVFRQKGIFVLLDAVERLGPEVRDRCEVSIFGAGLEEEPAETRMEFESRVASLRDVISVRGSYEPGSAPHLMASEDYIVVPSIWWENSPIVIQEAFAAGVPVICSNVGGMAEKVRDGVDGLHFRVNDPVDLARVLTRAVMAPTLRAELAAGVRRPPLLQETAGLHVRLYERLIVERQPAGRETDRPISGRAGSLGGIDA